MTNTQMPFEREAFFFVHLYQFFGVVLDLTAIAVVEYKHVERCGEARKYLVTKYN